MAIMYIQHDNNVRTLYGHIDAPLVSLNQYVEQRNDYRICWRYRCSSKVYHLHFEVIVNGVEVILTPYLTGAGT